MEIFAFDEFVYFFMHWTMRHAFILMTETEKKHLGKHLSRMVASVSVDAYFQHWPDKFKKGMIADFCTNLQKAEVEYATCAPGDIFNGSEAEKARNYDALFMTLGENVASTFGRQGDSELKLKIATLAVEQFGHLNLPGLVLDFKRDSMELSDD